VKLPRLHLVTSDEVLGRAGFVDAAARVIEACGPATAVHLRGHGLAGGALYALAERLLPVAARAGAVVLVNDRVDVAMACGAAGVQLGRRSIPVAEARRLLGPEALIGYSAHSAAEVLDAERAGANFVLLGTIFPTTSHPGEPGAGPDLVRATVQGARVPIVAIGGITPERAGAVLEAGAYGVAVLGGVWNAADPAEAARRYLAVFEEGTI